MHTCKYIYILRSTVTGDHVFLFSFAAVLSQPNCIYICFVWIGFVFDSGHVAHKGIHDHLIPKVFMNYKADKPSTCAERRGNPDSLLFRGVEFRSVTFKQKRNKVNVSVPARA